MRRTTGGSDSVARDSDAVLQIVVQLPREKPGIAETEVFLPMGDVEFFQYFSDGGDEIPVGAAKIVAGGGDPVELKALAWEEFEARAKETKGKKAAAD